MLIEKIRNYYRVFGFKQTFKKVFRYANEKLHTDMNGVYTPTKKEQKYIKFKSQRVYIFSDRPYSEKSEGSSLCARFYNSIGCAVSYYYLGNKIEKSVEPPLCFYGSFNAKQAKGMSFEDCIIILDTKGDMLLPLSYNAKKDKCFVIDLTKNAGEVSESYLCYAFNSLKSRDRCDERFYNNISVVILNYNNKNVIFNCLDTLIANNRKYGYEIIVVDNQSSDGSFEEIAKKYDSVKLYQNTKNGCSSGRNIGIENSAKEYVLFLDSDQWVLHENWLDAYLDIWADSDAVGAIGWTGGWFNSKGYSYHTVNNFSYRYMPPKALCRNDIGYLGTGGMMVERSVLDEIGGFDLNYDPTCYEDTDISLEIRFRGKELCYCPYLGVGHLPHQTTKSGSDEHEKMIRFKGDYFVSKWKKKAPSLLKYKK